MQVKNCVCSKSVAEFILLPKQVDGNNAWLKFSINILYNNG
jgi:hypothetical protein